MSRLTYVSLFSGICSATVAWKRLGWKPLAFAEIEPFPAALLAHRYPGVPNLGDVSRVDWSPYRGKADVVVGGSPCQAFSVAGLRKSLEDPRGNLTLEYVRAVHAIRPRYAVWENVPGVLSTADNAFGCFLAALVGAPEAIEVEEGWPSAGMVSGPAGRACWRLLDAQWFGLAQRRLRVFVVFCFGDGADPAEVLFERPRMLGNPPARGEAREAVTHGVAGSLGASGRGVSRGGESRGQDPVIAVPEIGFSLNAKGGGVGSTVRAKRS